MMAVSRILKTAALAAVLSAVAAPAQASPDVCGIETARQERLHGIPGRLLTAISHVESGRYDKSRRAVIAWPWTVMAEGKGRVLPNKAAAIAEVLALQRRGVRNIDVGCMQVNLHAHRGAFRDLNAAFDPATNVGYAAKFLTDLKRETGSWAKAGTHYHSRTSHLAAIYRVKLARAWARLQGQAGPATAAAAASAPPPAAKAAGAPGQILPPPSRAAPVIHRAVPPRPAKAAPAKGNLIDVDRELARKAAESWRREKLAQWRARNSRDD